MRRGGVGREGREGTQQEQKLPLCLLLKMRHKCVAEQLIEVMFVSGLLSFSLIHRHVQNRCFHHIRHFTPSQVAQSLNKRTGSGGLTDSSFWRLI